MFYTLEKYSLAIGGTMFNMPFNLTLQIIQLLHFLILSSRMTFIIKISHFYNFYVIFFSLYFKQFIRHKFAAISFKDSFSVIVLHIYLLLILILQI